MSFGRDDLWGAGKFGFNLLPDRWKTYAARALVALVLLVPSVGVPVFMFGVRLETSAIQAQYQRMVKSVLKLAPSTTTSTTAPAP